MLSYNFVSCKFKQQLFHSYVAELYCCFCILAAALDVDDVTDAESLVFYNLSDAQWGIAGTYC